MKRLETLLATVLDSISIYVTDFGLESNKIQHNIVLTEKFDIYIKFNVSIEYETLDETYNNVEAIKSITLNSAHVTQLTTDLQSDLPNVRKLLNERLVQSEGKVIFKS